MNSDWNAEISVKNQKLTETKEVFLNGQKEYVDISETVQLNLISKKKKN